MTTPTSNMGLLQAVDGDNSRSYLETSLATSLTTIDTHDHCLANISKGKLINFIPSGGLQVSSCNVGSGGAPGANVGVNLSGSFTGVGGFAYGYRMAGLVQAGATNNIVSGLSINGSIIPNGFANVSAVGVHILPTWGNAANNYGLLVGSVNGAAATNNYGVYVNIPSGASGNNFGVQINGADNTTSVPLYIATTTGRTSMLLSGTLSNGCGLGINSAELALFCGAGASIAFRDIGIGGTLGVSIFPSSSTVRAGKLILTTTTSAVAGGQLGLGTTTDALGGGGTALLGSIGGSGPVGTTQSGWWRFNLGGLYFWLPYWA